MSSEPAVRVANLSKSYQIYAHPRDRLKQMFMPRAQRLVGRAAKRYYREHRVLDGVSFEVERGQTVGVVGRNGSGKSTLLQILCGTLSADGGDVVMAGRVAALLELGAGFNPEFTGRENVYLAASLYGLRPVEIDARMDDIIAFADIGEYLDQPVKTYSSGMYVRLGFSVIVHVDADILVIDEALAVGDVFFQQKCMRFLKRFQEKGGSILLVTHDTASVLSLCSKALLLASGGERRAVFGPADEICRIYLEELYRDPQRSSSPEPALLPQPLPERPGALRTYTGKEQPPTRFTVSAFNVRASSFGERKAEITDVGFYDSDGRRLRELEAEQRVCLTIKARMNARVVLPAFGFMLKNRHGEYLFTEGSDMAFRERQMIFEAGETAVARFEFSMPHLIRGAYAINVAIAEGLNEDHQQQHWIHDALMLESIQSRLVHGYCGMHDLSCRIDVIASDA